MKKVLWIVCVVVLCVLAVRWEDFDKEKQEAVDYRVITGSDVPKHIMAIVENNKIGKYQAGYLYDEKLYIIATFGERESTGYTVSVREIYKQGNRIEVWLELITPNITELIEGKKSYPSIIVQVDTDIPKVIFK